jgi:agmatine deiminase
MRIIEELVPYVKVKIAVQDSNEMDKIKSLLENNNIPIQKVSFHSVPHGDIWFRDMGPIFIVSNKGKLKIVDFNFNGWGYESHTTEYARLEEKVDRLIAKEMGIETIMTRLISEGGDREFNGKGTMITVESVELQRNPNMPQDEIEKEFKRLFGVTKVIWLKKGIYEDDFAFIGTVWGPDGEKNAYRTGTTGGHIDEFCRFVDASTILLAQVTPEEAENDPIAKENHLRLEENFEILKNATDQDGKAFKIIRMPHPTTIYHTIEPGDRIYTYISELDYEDGSVFPKGKKVKVIPAMSYLNFLVSNGILLAPKYWKLGLPEIIKRKDEQAIKTLHSVFPNRKIVALDTIIVNLGGGGLHCISQQEPAVR